MISAADTRTTYKAGELHDSTVWRNVVLSEVATTTERQQHSR